jgi:hypothetical protein
VVQYKKGTNMPADYLSRLPSLPVNSVEAPAVAAFDPFTPDLQLLQCQDQDLQAIFQFLKNGIWHNSLSKQKIKFWQHWFQKSSLIKISLLGFGCKITNIPELLWGCQNDRESRLCVKLMTAFLRDIMLL